MANYKHKGAKMKLEEALEIIDIIKDIDNETFKKYFDTNIEVLVDNNPGDLAVAKFLRDLGFELSKTIETRQAVAKFLRDLGFESIKTIETGQNERF